MKNCILLGFLISLSATLAAQIRTSYKASIPQGQYIDCPGVWSPASAASIPSSAISDTLQVSDTVAYVFPVNHTNDVDLYQSFYWNKSGAGTATLTVLFFQGNDPYNLTAVTKGVLQSAYTKAFSLSASGWNYISFANDTARFTGRYLKVEYMTSNTASVGGKVFTRLKTNIK